MSSSPTTLLLLLLPIMLLLMTTNVNVTATPTTIERCLRLQLNPPPPPPANSGSRSALRLARIACKDAFRSISHSLHATGKLPLGYVFALCHIFQFNQQKVERHVARTFRPHHSHTLLAGRTCATMRKRQHAHTPSSFSSL
ncbi:unnamed protein product [Sphenostylis stenocarpa]|uniref:Pectinesterase inhibitor domain-containing protein n=1 Tax=Sphenostylis stenocarpa TaxID=92480 RepID=A0AA86VQZ5_9FABA|nr:unnamed protein product [Sphenostylis stenocarpa]